MSFFGNLVKPGAKVLKSISIGGLISALGGYALAHFDPTALTTLGATILGAVGAVVGVVVHHGNTPPDAGPGGS